MENTQILQQKNYHKNLKGLTPKQYWLLQHQITAFWHGFGLSGMLIVEKKPENFIEEPFRNKRENNSVIAISRNVMKDRLKQYINWLKSYKESWNNQSDDYEKQMYPNGFESFLEDEKKCDPETRELILEMISLLQNNGDQNGN